MTLLAHIISDFEGISAITDYSSLDRYGIFSRVQNKRKQSSINLAKATITTVIPKNIDQISFDQIIHFRNQRDFKQKLGAFNTEINNYLDNLEEGNSPTMFLESLNSIWKDFTGDIVKLGLGAINVGINIWTAMNSSQMLGLELQNKMVVIPAIYTVDSIIKINSTWKYTKNRRFARKYLASLKSLKTSRL